jgi:hypothetical protein
MAHLSDSVAQQIMGEINDLVKRIEAASDQIPQMDALQTAVKSVLQEFNVTAGVIVMGETARMKAELARGAIDVARTVADDIAGKNKWEWIAGSVALTFCAFSLFGWMMHNRGYSSGYAEGHEHGYVEARDEKSAASWANTPEGRLAYGLAQAGSIRELATCNGDGWVLKNGACLPNIGSNHMIYGWKIKS